MKIAIEGCAHGELEQIYDTIEYIQKKENIKPVDLLICCGDFQASRNLNDLTTMAIPVKFRDICTFYKYYSGEKVAPILTIFIGGNHEASAFLQELPYGGWVAKNIYYMGYSGVININGLRLSGISGIFKNHDYPKGRFESPPYSEDTKRSVYHVRMLDVWRMKHLSGSMDICISHDWPRGIYHHGDTRDLIRSKPFFAQEIESNSLGSRPCEELLNHLQPNYWFSAHLHCKFAAVVEHKGGKSTKFLALDKCLPKRKFLHILDIGEELPENTKPTLSYDLEWLTILHLTNHFISVKNSPNYLPNKQSVDERGVFTPTEEELNAVKTRLNNDLRIKEETFEWTATPHDVNKNNHQERFKEVNPVSNRQTRELCDLLNIDDPLQLVLAMSGRTFEEYKVPEKTEGQEVITVETKGDGEQVDDRDVVIEEEVIVERTRTSLSLPKPKILMEEDKEEQKDGEIKHNPEEIQVSDGDDDNNDKDDIDTVKVDSGDKKEDDLPTGVIEDTQGSIPMSTTTEGEAGECKSIDPVLVMEAQSEEAVRPVKRFKRRNESIYNAADDDE